MTSEFYMYLWDVAKGNIQFSDWYKGGLQGRIDKTIAMADTFGVDRMLFLVGDPYVRMQLLIEWLREQRGEVPL